MNISRLSSAQVHAALDAVVAGTCILSLLTAGLLVQRRSAVRPAPPAAEPAGRPWWPWAGFLLVCALLVLNQLVVNAYILGCHAGDPAFITRYLGRGWFALAPTEPSVRWLVANLPERWLKGPLSYSLLRVQAVLELPFALLAYLAVVAMLDGALYRRLVRSVLLPLSAVSFTVTFCLIEVRLQNPWTGSDLYARWLAALAVVVAWAAQRLAIKVPPTELAAPRLGLGGLLIFFGGAAAVGAVVLVMYDAALLYNLGHLRGHLPILGASVLLGGLAVLVRTVAESRAADTRRRGPGLQALTAVLGAFAVVFFAPSLSIRYCGARPSALFAAALLLLSALLLGLRLAGRGDRAWGRAVLGLAVFLATALLLVFSDFAGLVFGRNRSLLELRLLQHAALIFPTAALAVWLLDRLLGGIGTRRGIRG